MKLGKMFFNSLLKLFSFSRKSNFRILDFQISWRHLMPKHKTRNTFYWITWEVITVCKWNLASLCHILKEIVSSKNFTNTAAWKLVPGLFVFAKNLAQPLLENEIFEAIYLYQICNSKAIEISPNQQAGLLRFLFREDSLKTKQSLELVSRSHSSYNFLMKKLFL